MNCILFEKPFILSPIFYLVVLKNFWGYYLLVYNWPHFVGQNHFYVMMLSNRDFAIQKCFQKILHSFKLENSIPC
jgi:hypothetical protein